VTSARLVSWVAIAIIAVGSLAYGTIDGRPSDDTADRVHAIASTIRCPQCRSQSAADSDASTAKAVRTEIAERVEAGQSASEIRAYFASRYGDEILLTPPASGLGSLVWVLPVAAFVSAAGGLALAFRRWRRQ
jgi:cytochrome c-type biogenesis protein CcmH